MKKSRFTDPHCQKSQYADAPHQDGARHRRSLRQAREAARLTQVQLGFDAKVDRTYISFIENGHKSPTVDILFRICPVLGIAPSELLSDVEQALQSRRR